MVLAAMNNDAQAERMARHTLEGQLHLLDAAWGGVYQYSAGSDWNSPHFEKIMQMQAENLRIYSLAYARWQDPTYLHAAREIRRYLKAFLASAEGGFYTSQDADLIDGQDSAGYFALDDAQRRKLGYRGSIRICMPAKTAGPLPRWQRYTPPPATPKH